MEGDVRCERGETNQACHPGGKIAQPYLAVVGHEGVKLDGREHDQQVRLVKEARVAGHVQMGQRPDQLLRRLCKAVA